jgi:hypothetical protein
MCAQYILPCKDDRVALRFVLFVTDGHKRASLISLILQDNSFLRREINSKVVSKAGLLPKRKLTRSHAVMTLAMVNVDFASPSLVLGAALIGCGVLLLQVRGHSR